MGYETLLYEKKDGIGIVTINRPDALNALNSQVFGDLYALMKEIEKDSEVSAVIITGSGPKAFAAGTDIKEMESLSCNGAREFAQGVKKTLDKIESLKKPVIAAINGFALGGGCELAMACDLRIGSEKAKLGQPEINLAVIPGAGGTQRLVRLVGSSIAKDLLFTGKIIDAQTSLSYGLLNNVVPPESLMEEAEKVASIIASKSPLIMGLMKDVVNTGRNLDLPAALDYEIECFAQCFATEDQKEGFKAFIEKRKPVFTGK
jgi:enoyl-CoA hydratase